MALQLLVRRQVACRPAYVATAWNAPSNSRSFRTGRTPTFKSLQDGLELDGLEEFEGDDTTAIGHKMLRQQRELLELFRKIQFEMPQLKDFRRKFMPPPTDKYLVHRTIWYGGEEHPARLKAVLVLPVAKLPLKADWAIHKFKLIAGPRWSTNCPKDGGFSSEELKEWGTHGFIKISCEDMPDQAANLEWCSATLDRMLEKANDASDKFTDIPLDTRHIVARERKSGIRKRDSRRYRRASIADFPQEWLPDLRSPALEQPRAPAP